MTHTLEVRPFAGAEEYARMVAYFVDASDDFLRGMGVDRPKLPSREEWLRAALLDHGRPAHEKERAWLAWVLDGNLVGHSSINFIRVGEEAYIHLHLWIREARQAGLGTRFFQMSAERFARDFRLQRIWCEPCADNPGPNRVLPKAGFRFVKRYRTVPGPIQFEQDVNRWIREFSVAG